MLNVAILLVALMTIACALGLPEEKCAECSSEIDSHNIQKRDVVCLAVDTCYENRLYYFEASIKRTRNGAANDCQYRGMKLVSVESNGEHIFIQNTIRRMQCINGNFWTSGYRNGTRAYYWTATQEPFVFTKWKPNQPTRQPGFNCVHYRNHHLQWKNDDCAKGNRYICESDYYCE